MKWCRQCLDEKSEYERQSRASKRAAGIPPKPATERQKERQKKYDRARSQRPERKELSRDISKRRYEERKSQGLCIECGEEAEDGKTRCGRHLEILRESSRRIAARKKAEREKEKSE